MKSERKYGMHPFITYLCGDLVNNMNVIYHRVNWPIMLTFLFYEKIYNKIALTEKDIRNILRLGYATNYLKHLAFGDYPIVKIIAEESPTRKDQFTFTKSGRIQAELMWKYLEFLSKDKKETLEQFMERMKKIRSLEISPDAEDIEEKEIKKIEENNRILREKEEALRAGIPQIPSSPQDSSSIKIDLEKVETKIK